MQLYDEAVALRDKVDELALRCACLDEWRLADAQLFAALVEGQHQACELQKEMVASAKRAQCWGWVRSQAALREIRELLDDLRVLRMCVQSRMYELAAAAAQ